MNLPENIAAAIRESGGRPDGFRIETQCGRNIVCGGILPLSCLKVGQTWGAGCSVHIDAITEHQTTGEYARTVHNVHYSWTENGRKVSHVKENFAFQCRYCLVVD